MTNLDSILKSRDITLPTKVHLVKAMAFPVDSLPCEPPGKPRPEQPLGRGSALSRLGAELELRRSGSSLGPSQ